MCGRYSIVTPPKELAAYFGLLPPEEFFKGTPDARPTQTLPIVIDEDPKRIIMGHWGYPMKIGGAEKELINTRTETIKEKPFMRKAAEQHRCIILTDGFYEWKSEADKKQKIKFTYENQPMALAGIYQWKTKSMSDDKMPFFSIITTTPNSDVAPIHDRMPVILSGDIEAWLRSPMNVDLLVPFSKHLVLSNSS